MPNKNDQLRELIHRYAEDREIDYMSAKLIGEARGMKFKNEQALLEWKQTIDSYLKMFDEKSFQRIVEASSFSAGAIMPKYSGSTDHDHRNDLQRKYDDYKKAGGGESFAQFTVKATSLTNAGKSGADLAKEEAKLSPGRKTAPDADR